MGAWSIGNYSLDTALLMLNYLLPYASSCRQDRAMEQQQTSFEGTTDFWTTGVVVLALLVLHFARDQCATRPYERQMMMFFDYSKEASKVIDELSETNIGLEKSNKHTIDTAPVRGIEGVSDQFDVPLYEDEHILIFSKPTTSIKPKTQVEVRQYGLESGITHFTDGMAVQWLFADMIYGFQLYIMYKRLHHNSLTLFIGTLDRFLSAVDLIAPMGVLVVSTMFFIHDITTLNKDYADTAREKRAWLTSVLEWSILGGSLILLYFFVTSI